MFERATERPTLPLVCSPLSLLISLSLSISISLSLSHSLSFCFRRAPGPYTLTHPRCSARSPSWYTMNPQHKLSMCSTLKMVDTQSFKLYKMAKSLKIFGPSLQYFLINPQYDTRNQKLESKPPPRSTHSPSCQTPFPSITSESNPHPST